MQVAQLNLRHLRVFREVAHCRSVSRAAPAVHLSQPAITQAIARLEEQLGARLFDRRSDGMAPTAAGGLFLARVERALAQLRNGAREAQRLAARRQGSGGRAGGFAAFEALVTMAQLRALIAVSTAENFSLAARTLGVAQPSLHRAARDLERLSGLSLYVRTASGIALTGSAAALAQAARLAFAELEQGFAELDELAGTDRGRITVGALPLPRSHLLPAAIEALLARRPEVQVAVVDGPYADLLHDLRHGGIDLLVGALRDPPPIDDIVQEPLFSDPLAVVGRAGHPLGRRRRIGLDDLAAHPWVLPRAGTPTRDSFERLFTGRTAPPCCVETSSLVLVRALLAGSDRLTLISAHQIRHEVATGQLAPLPFPLPGSARPIGATMRRDWRPTAAQALFLEGLRQAGQRLGGTDSYSESE